MEESEDIYDKDYEEEYAEDFEEEIDSYEEEAIDAVQKLFNDNKEKVYYGRQIEFLLENQFFHWVTNRALRVLADQKIISKKVNMMGWGGSIILYFHNSFRYYKREASKVIKIVEAYSADVVSFSVGQYGELLILEGFAKFQFVLRGRNVNEFMGKKWIDSNHNLDMIIERDGIGYGIEIKNTLGYINKEEFEIKIELCRFLGLKPVFVARMLPKNWMYVLIGQGGFGLLLKYQLFPPYLGTLAGQMENELGLPVKSPKSLFDGTIKRFENWHKKNVNSV